MFSRTYSIIYLFIFFFKIARTYDTDFDADLWKETSFFARKVTRYLCVSRLESIVDYVLENLVIINDKELPPEGYGSIPKTCDTGNLFHLEVSWLFYKSQKIPISTSCPFMLERPNSIVR